MRREPVDVTIGRAVIPMPSVLGDTRDADNRWDFFLVGQDRIGYVRITSFGEDTVEELAAALAWLAERQARGLILDLRNNRGGVFDQAVETCDLFLDAGRIVSTRGRGGAEIDTYHACLARIARGWGDPLSHVRLLFKLTGSGRWNWRFRQDRLWRKPR